MNLPQERIDLTARTAIRDSERRVVRAMLWCSPLLFLVGWIVAAVYWRSLLFLQPPNEIGSVWTIRIGIAGGVVLALIPSVWWVTLRVSKPDVNRFSGLISASIVCVLLVAAGLVLDQPKTRFTLEEAVKARAPQLDFVRNVAFKQQLLRTTATPTTDVEPRIVIIGSSQINLGIDAELLQESSGVRQVHSLCMPGMVPIQYLSLVNGLSDQRPTHVICWLSEFDFFRETSLPTVRLRWCSDSANLGRIRSTLTTRQQLGNRGELADLWLACLSPIWQQRSLLSLVTFRFWWPWNSGSEEVDEDEANVGGQLVDQQQGVENARRNIARTAMVEANFKAFGEFARVLTDKKIRLIVIEGESHPDTMKAYPQVFRLETRERMRQMSDSIGFEYLDENKRPSFAVNQWRDAVHLNEQGRDHLTRFVARIIDQKSRDGQTPEQ